MKTSTWFKLMKGAGLLLFIGGTALGLNLKADEITEWVDTQRAALPSNNNEDYYVENEQENDDTKKED